MAIAGIPIITSVHCYRVIYPY